MPYAKANGDYNGYTKMMGDAISSFGEHYLEDFSKKNHY